jgi:glycosyltransferase 2 family protein
MKRWLTIFVGLVISAIALYFAFRQADFGEIAEAFRNANYIFVALATLLVVVTVCIRGLRWSVLTEGRISFADGVWLFNIGFLFNNVLPARLGEIARAVLAGRRPRMHFTSALSSIVVERLFDMVAVGILIGMVLIFLDLPPWATTAGGIMAGGAVLGIIFLAFAAHYPEPALSFGSRVLAILPRIGREQAEHFLRPFVEGLAGVSRWPVFIGGMILSVIAWLASGFAAWVLMHAFWDKAPLIMGMLAVAAAGLGIAVPAAPSGVGPFEAVVLAAFTAIGYEDNLTRSYALTLHLVNFLVTSVIGIIGLVREGTSFAEVARAAEAVTEKAPEVAEESAV